MEIPQQPTPPAAQPQPAPQAQPGAQPAGKPGPQADPKAQEQHRKVVLACMKMLYSSAETVKRVVQMVASAGDPAEGVARATNLIIGQVLQQAKGLSPQIAYTAAMPLAVLIIELATEAKVVGKGELTIQAVIESWKKQAGGPAAAPAAAAPGEEPSAEPAEEPQPPAEQDDDDEVDPAPPGGVINEEMEA